MGCIQSPTTPTKAPAQIAEEIHSGVENSVAGTPKDPCSDITNPIAKAACQVPGALSSFFGGVFPQNPPKLPPQPLPVVDKTDKPGTPPSGNAGTQPDSTAEVGAQGAAGILDKAREKTAQLIPEGYTDPGEAGTGAWGACKLNGGSDADCTSAAQTAYSEAEKKLPGEVFLSAQYQVAKAIGNAQHEADLAMLDGAKAAAGVGDGSALSVQAVANIQKAQKTLKDQLEQLASQADVTPDQLDALAKKFGASVGESAATKDYTQILATLKKDGLVGPGAAAPAASGDVATAQGGGTSEEVDRSGYKYPNSLKPGDPGCTACNYCGGFCAGPGGGGRGKTKTPVRLKYSAKVSGLP